MLLYIVPPLPHTPTPPPHHHLNRFIISYCAMIICMLLIFIGLNNRTYMYGDLDNLDFRFFVFAVNPFLTFEVSVG